MILFLLNQNESNAFQIAAWQAAVVGAILGTIQFALGMLRQWKEDKRRKAEMGYQLLDAMFDDPNSKKFLRLLDSTNPVHKEGTQATTSNLRDIEIALTAIGGPVEKRIEALQFQLDCFFYYLDRCEHAIASGITNFDTLKMPTGYYIRLLLPLKNKLNRYVENVGYERVSVFLNRYDYWKRA
jgi:hypothetical protein